MRYSERDVMMMMMMMMRHIGSGSVERQATESAGRMRIHSFIPTAFPSVTSIIATHQQAAHHHHKAHSHLCGPRVLPPPQGSLAPAWSWSPSPTTRLTRTCVVLESFPHHKAHSHLCGPRVLPRGGEGDGAPLVGVDHGVVLDYTGAPLGGIAGLRGDAPLHLNEVCTHRGRQVWLQSSELSDGASRSIQ